MDHIPFLVDPDETRVANVSDLFPSSHEPKLTYS